jgi:primosomal protein N' (replication factor Y)
MADSFVKVAVAAPLPEPLTYAYDPDLIEGPVVDGGLAQGHAVLVPLGSRVVNGWVVERLDACDIPIRSVKPVQRLLDARPVFGPEQLRFLAWAARYYLAPLGEMLGTALPSGARAKTRRVLVPADKAAEALAAEQVPEPRATVLREVIQQPGRTPRSYTLRLQQELEPAQVKAAIAALKREGLIQGANRELGTSRDKVQQVHLLIDPAQLETHAVRPGARMRGVVVRLAEAGGSMDLPDLLKLEGEYARTAITKLADKGVLELRARERMDPVQTGDLGGAAPDPLPPTAAQQAVLEAIAADGPGTTLLHGITGSGKTEVYLQAAARALETGKQVLVLVPEIGLTPQLVGRFRARFGDRVAVLHSGLTGVERLRSWRRIRSGHADVAVGARSALFAPFQDLGLVVVDEEHDDSYKQDDGVRYHARDLAVVRGAMAGCPVVLGSATPSAETLQNAIDGRYRLRQLTDRISPRPMPELELIDLNQQPRGEDGKRPLLSQHLVAALEQTLAAGGKAILLHNRRGYATIVQCPDCGGRYTCPSCDISLVLHKRHRKLTCHYCGLQRPFREDCPSCGGEVEILGEGAEQLEETLERLFPWAPVARMDADTTASRGAHHRILEGFRTGKSRLLVGTQVVAKGHDFPDVQLAAAVNIDMVLNLPDFRSTERTWALCTQLAGRAGRGDQPGRVVLQTHHPDHFVFRTLDDPEAFLAQESRLRTVLGYPPFARLVLVRVESADRAACLNAAASIGRDLRRALPEGRVVDVLGPAPSPLARLVGRWRYQLLLRGWQMGPFRRWLDAQAPGLLASARDHRGVRVTVDVDPRSVM